MSIVEPKPERIRSIRREGEGPMDLLARWGALTWALVKVLGGGMVLGAAVFFSWGLLMMEGILPSGSIISLVILGVAFVATVRLFAAWALPIRY